MPSTEKETNGNTSTHSQPQPLASPTSKWYHHITELPLRKYIDCIVDENLQALTISGFPSAEDLQKAWLNITEEYADAMGDSERSLITKLYREITELSISLTQCAMIIEVLSVFVSEKDERILRYQKDLNSMLNQRFTFKVDKRKAEMARASRLLKGFDLKLALKQDQLKAMQAKQKGSNTPINREYFQSALISLSDFAKYHVSDMITTYEYCERCKRIHEYVQKAKIKPHA